jgi:hypothetical protein
VSAVADRDTGSFAGREKDFRQNAYRVHDQCVAFPATNRVAMKAQIRIFRMRAAVGVNTA